MYDLSVCGWQLKRAKPIQASEAQPKAQGQGRTVFVVGLSFDATDEDIKQFFADCGAIEYVQPIQSFNGSWRVSVCVCLCLSVC